MRKITSIAVFLLVILLAVYLSIPVPGFPIDPPGSLSSVEPADTESIYRRSFYTSFSRSELMDYYKLNFKPNLSLNYPPEQSSSLIRDQTRSSWLEELLHVGKDSLFINGYYPTKSPEQININGVHYAAKVTVRYLPSSLVVRYTILSLATISVIWIIKEYELV